jgi:hypothetical protein
MEHVTYLVTAERMPITCVVTFSSFSEDAGHFSVHQDKQP